MKRMRFFCVVGIFLISCIVVQGQSIEGETVKKPEGRFFLTGIRGLRLQKPEVSALQQFNANVESYNRRLSLVYPATGVSRDRFNPYSLSFNWKKGLNYQPHSMYLLYRLQDLYAINYNPSSFQEEKLNSYVRFMKGGNSSLLSSEFEKDRGIRSVISNAAVNNPELVKYTWAEVPEPGKAIKEGWKLDKKRLDDRAVGLLSYDDLDTKRKIDKPKAVKSPWHFSGSEYLQLTQAYLNNWVKGGESSVNLSSDLRFKAIYKNNKHEWESSGIHKIGILTSGETGRRLSEDLVDLSSKYGLKAANNWYYSFLTTFKTQLFYGYAASDTKKEKPLSGFLSPAYMQFIVGMDYKRDGLSILLSPLTSIVTVVNDTAKIDQTRFKIPANKKSTSMNGFSITTNWKKNFTREISYTTRMELFYQYQAKDGQKRFDWENILDLKVNRYLSTRVLLQLRYFDNESDKFQIRENINIAFKYSF
jgi:hypothetical protein